MFSLRYFLSGFYKSFSIITGLGRGFIAHDLMRFMTEFFDGQR